MSSAQTDESARKLPWASAAANILARCDYGQVEEHPIAGENGKFSPIARPSPLSSAVFIINGTTKDRTHWSYAHISSTTGEEVLPDPTADDSAFLLCHELDGRIDEKTLNFTGGHATAIEIRRAADGRYAWAHYDPNYDYAGNKGKRDAMYSAMQSALEKVPKYRKTQIFHDVEAQSKFPMTFGLQNKIPGQNDDVGYCAFLTSCYIHDSVAFGAKHAQDEVYKMAALSLSAFIARRKQRSKDFSMLFDIMDSTADKEQLKKAMEKITLRPPGLWMQVELEEVTEPLLKVMGTANSLPALDSHAAMKFKDSFLQLPGNSKFNSDEDKDIIFRGTCEGIYADFYRAFVYKYYTVTNQNLKGLPNASDMPIFPEDEPQTFAEEFARKVYEGEIPLKNLFSHEEEIIKYKTSRKSIFVDKFYAKSEYDSFSGNTPQLSRFDKKWSTAVGESKRFYLGVPRTHDLKFNDIYGDPGESKLVPAFRGLAEKVEGVAKGVFLDALKANSTDEVISKHKDELKGEIEGKATPPVPTAALTLVVLTPGPTPAGPPKQTGGLLGARRSIDVPKSFGKSVPIMPEEDEVTMDELKRISITLKDMDEGDLFNFSVLYSDEDGIKHTLKLVDEKYTILLPKGIIGQGAMGVVGVYKLPNDKLVALKLERKKYESAFTLEAFDARCSIQSPVISVTPSNSTGPDDFSAMIFRYDDSKVIETYNLAYVMPMQSGDGNALFKLLVGQLDTKVITKEEFVSVLVELYADMAKQTFCVLREDVTIHDIKPDNFLYRRTGERQVRLMFTDWGLWQAANQYVILYPGVDKVDKFEAEGTYSLIPLLLSITMVLTENISDEAKRAAAAVKTDALLEKKTENATQRLIHACSKSAPAYAEAVADHIKACPLAAYFVCDVLDKYKSEVELTRNGQIRFLQQGSAAQEAPAGKKKPGGKPPKGAIPDAEAEAAVTLTL